MFKLVLFEWIDCIKYAMRRSDGYVAYSIEECLELAQIAFRSEIESEPLETSAVLRQSRVLRLVRNCLPLSNQYTDWLL